MRVLLIKTSSMGDIIHTLPALSDAARAIADIQFDWVVEEPFAEIPRWHPAVANIYPVALRRWRKHFFAKQTRIEWHVLRQQLNVERYDLILDAQSLVKSAFLAFFARGPRAGLDWQSARESFAALAYQRKYTVNFYQHAIVRMRSLFSKALNYELPNTSADFGINRQQFRLPQTAQKKYIVFLHGTTWATKLWPEVYWQELAKLALAAGYDIKMSGGNQKEIERAERIAKQSARIQVLPRLSIGAMASLLAQAEAAVAVDTGFGHLATAMNLPTVSLYGPTNPTYTGAVGNSSVHLAADFVCAPCLQRECSYKQPTAVTPACFTELSPARVWRAVANLLSA